MLEGEIRHKDSLGSDQWVKPSDVSGMMAGSAIAHVERPPKSLMAIGFRMHSLQIWQASPKEHEQGHGYYSHYSTEPLPFSDNLGVKIRIIAGSGFCLESPVPVRSPTL